jgi:hypothetical protein
MTEVHAQAAPSLPPLADVQAVIKQLTALLTAAQSFGFLALFPGLQSAIQKALTLLQVVEAVLTSGGPRDRASAAAALDLSTVEKVIADLKAIVAAADNFGLLSFAPGIKPILDAALAVLSAVQAFLTVV